MPVLRRQPCELARPDIGRIGDDDIVRGAPQRAEVVGSQQPHPMSEPVTAHVDARHRKSTRRDVDPVHARARQRPGTGDRDAARARTDIEHSPHPCWLDPGCKAPLDQLGNGRAWNEDTRIDRDARSHKPGTAGEIGGGNALTNAAREQLLHALRAGLADTAPVERGAPRGRQP